MAKKLAMETRALWARTWKKSGRDITVHVIGYREGESEYFKARCIADETGGKYYSVSTEDQLIEALRKTLGCPFLTLNFKPILSVEAHVP